MTTRYGLLVTGLNYSNLAEDEFNDWYDTEHLPRHERAEGFINAQRWLGAEDPKLSIATYDLECVDVLQAPANRTIASANFSPWSKRVERKCQQIFRLEAEQTVPGKQAGPACAGGLLIVAMNIAPEAEADFNAWYNEEHIPRLSGVAGCLCARRFKIVGCAHRYLAMYHLTLPEVPASLVWKEAGRKTAWRERLQPYIHDPLRLVLRRYIRKS